MKMPNFWSRGSTPNVERGVPIPAEVLKPVSFTDNVEKMGVGDSMNWPMKPWASYYLIAEWIEGFGRSKGRKFVFDYFSEGTNHGMRVWRTD